MNRRAFLAALAAVLPSGWIRAPAPDLNVVNLREALREFSAMRKYENYYLAEMLPSIDEVIMRKYAPLRAGRSKDPAPAVQRSIEA